MKRKNALNIQYFAYRVGSDIEQSPDFRGIDRPFN